MRIAMRPLLRIGMLTPSSNTVLEPMTSAMLQGIPDLSVHYSRLPVTEISLADASIKQFERGAYLAAAELLADARVNVIGWNGTSASWSGFDADTQLCRAIKCTFNVETTTAVLAINELLEAFKVRRLALVTPYVSDIQKRIVNVYEQAGYECVSEQHFGEQINYAFAEIGDEALTRAVRTVADADPEAIVIMCTNLRAAHLASTLETELNIPILDSVAAFVWKAVQLCGIDTRRLGGWGQLFNITSATLDLQDEENV